MITAIAIDDEPLALKLISQHCEKIEFLNLKKVFTNPDEAITYLSENKIDLIFLDIQMPDINGLQFYKKLSIPAPQVIFTTAYKDFAVEGFNVDAVDYLLKPFDFERFNKAILKAKEYIEFLSVKEVSNNALFVKVNYEMMKINLKDIEFIEALDDYIKIHVKPVSVLTLMTLKNVLEKLPSQEFIRIHRSYIVPISKIQKFSKNKVIIGGKELSIGSSYGDVYDLLMSRSHVLK